MDLKKLEYLNTVYDLKSFTKAADFHYVSQPTITMAVRKLEDELNCTFIDRDTKPLAFTPAGEFFMPYVKNILKAITDSQAALNEYNSLQPQILKLCLSSSAGNGLPSMIYTDFHSKYPSCQVALVELTMQMIFDQLMNETLDLAFSLIPDEVDLERFRVLLIQDCELCLLVNKKHPLAGKSSVTFEELKNERILSFPKGSLILEKTEHAARLDHVVLNFEYIYQPYVMEDLVRQNYGIATIIQNSQSIAMDPRTFSIVHFEKPIMIRQGFIMKKNHKPTLAMRQMIEYISGLAGIKEKF